MSSIANIDDTTTQRHHHTSALSSHNLSFSKFVRLKSFNMSSDQPKQTTDRSVAPFQRPGLTYADHINNLIRGPLFSKNNLKKTTSAMSSPDSTPSDASGSPYRPRSPRPLPTLAEADERRRRLCEEMERMWPSEPLRAPDFGGPSDPIPEALQAQGIQGFDRELEDIIVAKHEKTMRYKEFHVEWTDLQTKLLKVSKELRAEYDGLIEQIESAHHKHIHHRNTKTEYTSARQPLTDQMDILFERLGKFVFTLGTMYAVSRAVAQGACPTGDFDFGKLKIVCI